VNAPWPSKPLSEVCQIRPPKAEVRRRLRDSDLVSFMPMEDLGIDQKSAVPSRMRPLGEVVGSYTYFAEGDVLLAKITPCFENGKLGIARNLSNGVGFGSSEYIVFRPSRLVDAGWLYYFLSRTSFRREGEARMGGAVGHKRVALDFIDSYAIPTPPVSEQRRIVAILDEAFAGIDTAMANTAKNIENAREIFDDKRTSLLTCRESTTQRRSLGEICEIASRLINPRETSTANFRMSVPGIWSRSQAKLLT
jgi:type I restriction enzyme, S subunit